MRKQKQSNNDDLQPSRGLLGLFHKIVMIILWPFRKPYIAIPLLILMYLIPTFIGARPTEVHIWYWNKIKGCFTPVSEQIIIKSKEIATQTNLNIPSIAEIKNRVMSKSSPEDSVPSNNTGSKEQEIRRQAFDKSTQDQKPISIDIMQQEQPEAPKFVSEPPKSTLTPRTDKEHSAELPPIDITVKTQQPKLDLIYLDTPQEISGEAYVVNANEIIIANNDIFLFGIYVNPNSREGMIGKDFLQKFIGSDPVYCRIEAYTRQGIATGMCYVRQISINHTLVNNGISQNVAL